MSEGQDVTAVTVRFDEDRSAPARARRAVRSALQTWGLPDLGELAELVVSELVTNVVLHARSAGVLRIVLTADHLRVEVDDPSTATPTVKHYGSDATTGRGLHLLDHLTERWGTEQRDSGKTVWAELARTASLRPKATVSAPDADAVADLVASAPEEDTPEPRGPRLALRAA